MKLILAEFASFFQRAVQEDDLSLLKSRFLNSEKSNSDARITDILKRVLDKYSIDPAGFYTDFAGKSKI